MIYGNIILPTNHGCRKQVCLHLRVMEQLDLLQVCLVMLAAEEMPLPISKTSGAMILDRIHGRRKRILRELPGIFLLLLSYSTMHMSGPDRARYCTGTCGCMILLTTRGRRWVYSVVRPVPERLDLHWMISDTWAAAYCQ